MTMSDQPPKSAYEIAMERLRQKDVAEGVERRPPTEEQKATMTEVRNVYEAKLAQEDVMHKSALLRTVDPEERATIDTEYQRTRARLVSERDAKIARIRSGEPDPSL
jgi:hypothetical protein